MKNHVLDHFKEPLLKLLPKKPPFICPICSKKNRDKITLLRHYAFAHQMVFKLTVANPDDFKPREIDSKIEISKPLSLVKNQIQTDSD